MNENDNNVTIESEIANANVESTTTIKQLAPVTETATDAPVPPRRRRRVYKGEKNIPIVVLDDLDTWSDTAFRLDVTPEEYRMLQGDEKVSNLRDFKKRLKKLI